MPLKSSPLTTEKPTSSIAASHWQIDQSTLHQGWSAEALARIAQWRTQADVIWQSLDVLAARQPIVDTLSADALAEIERMTRKLDAIADTLVVIGTGGASLGAQALCAFGAEQSRVIFLENCDANSVQTLFARCQPERTAWLIISKSGETVETLATSLALLAHYEAVGACLDYRVVVVTSPGARPLRTLAMHHQWQIMDHPADLGGRFSVFSVVGMLPACFSGHAPTQLRDAAVGTWHTALATRDPSLFEAACWFAASLETHPLHVVMGYSDRLRPYTQWYKQLWAESLGKEGRGPTPITAVGAIDQHSQLQLYLDGARDKLFTLILPEMDGTALPLAETSIPELGYLNRHSMQDIMHAASQATVATMRSKQLPVRVLTAKLHAVALCELMARTMLETLLVAAMLAVDPYSQPAVEEGKQRARRSLGMHDDAA